MSKSAEKLAEQTDALKRLREIVKPGDTLYTILRHRSSSVSVIKINGRGRIFDLDYLLRRGLDYKFDEKNGGLKVGKVGVDMGFSVVYHLSNTLYGHLSTNGYKCLGDHCPSNSHVNDLSAPRGKGVRHNDGYAISQCWL